MHFIEKIKRILPVLAFLAWDSISMALAFLISAGLLHGTITADSLFHMPLFLAIAIPLSTIANALAGCYSGIWRHVGMGDSLRLLFSQAGTFAGVFAAHRVVEFFILGRTGIRYDHLLLAAVFAFLLMGMGRFSVRMTESVNKKFAKSDENAKRVLIYGAGEAGRYLYEKLRSHLELKLNPIVFLDDDLALKGKRIGSVKIAGGKKMLAESIKKYNIDEVIVAAPTASGQLLEHILQSCRMNSCSIRRFGSLGDIDISTAAITDINVEELLRRDSVELNMKTVNSFIQGKTVLVTGGAGSIGSEICRQVLAFGAKHLVIFDVNENGLFHIDVELREKYKTRYSLLIGSTRDVMRLNEVFGEYKPEIVFHAAAQKHVPLTEFSPREAIKTNVVGTKNVSQAAIIHKCEKMILISTDKAVNPTNIMGASKRIAEMNIQMIDQFSPITHFAAVRFGNVLGSNGSVVPLFQKQIAKGGPVTVTHQDMRRYFMTIPEAVQLVLEAGAISKGGEILVLDMGDPVRIYDLACDIIRLHGKRPNIDIKIEFTGLRPGDKLFEEISLKEENSITTSNKKIFILKPQEYDEQQVASQIKELESSLEFEDNGAMFKSIKDLVPTLEHKLTK